MTTGGDGLMLDLLTALAAVFSGAAVLVVALGLHRYRLQAQLDTRLQAFVAVSPGADSRRRVRSPINERLAPALSWFGRQVRHIVPARSVDRMRVDLLSAGYSTPRALSNYLASKGLLALLLALPGALLAVTVALSPAICTLLSLIGLLIGFYFPQVWLRNRIAQRRVLLSRSLPDVLDLLAISVSAGLGFDGALTEVVKGWQNPLTDELNTVQRDMRLGKSRREALRSFNDRAGVPEVAGLVAVVVQADELGTPLREALRLLSEQMRQQRRQKAEERARQAVIKMLIPMVLFIFPAIFIVLIGPTIPTMLSIAGGAP